MSVGFAIRVEAIYLEVLASAGDEALVHTTEAGVDVVRCLRAALKLAQQALVLQVPQVHALRLAIQ